MNKPLVSVVIPACNEEHFITKCLESLKAQTYKGPVEIIVVDNNSTDKTSELARAAGATVLFERTPGVCPARDTGTQAAKGDIVVSTDADTTFPSDWLERIVTAFEQNPKAVGVAGSFIFDNPPWWAKPSVTKKNVWDD